MLVWENMGINSSVDKKRHHPNTNKELEYPNISYNTRERFLTKIFYPGLVYKVLKKYH